MLKTASHIVASGENAPDGAMLRRHPTHLELLPPGRGVFRAVRPARKSDDDAIVEPLVILTIASPVPPMLVRMWEQADVGDFPAEITELDEDAIRWEWEYVADQTLDEAL